MRIFISCARLCSADVAPVEQPHRIAVRRAAALGIGNLDVEVANLVEQGIDATGHVADLRVDVVAEALRVGGQLCDALGQRLPLKHDGVADRKVFGLIQHIGDAVDEVIHQGADAVVTQFADEPFELGIDVLRGRSARTVADRIVQPVAVQLVDLLHNAVDLHSHPQDQTTVLRPGAGERLMSSRM